MGRLTCADCDGVGGVVVSVLPGGWKRRVGKKGILALIFVVDVHAIDRQPIERVTVLAGLKSRVYREKKTNAFNCILNKTTPSVVILC